MTVGITPIVSGYKDRCLMPDDDFLPAIVVGFVLLGWLILNVVTQYLLHFIYLIVIDLWVCWSTSV